VAKFPAIGTTYKGRLLEVDKQQQTDFDTGALLTWDDGTPRWQYVFTIQTDERSDDPADDGKRRIFAKGQMLTAIKGALRDAGVRPGDVIEGGTLTVRYAEDGEAKPRKAPPKIYKAKFEAGPRAVAPAIDEDPF
jgi:hypothetical protein